MKKIVTIIALVASLNSTAFLLKSSQIKRLEIQITMVYLPIIATVIGILAGMLKNLLVLLILLKQTLTVRAMMNFKLTTLLITLLVSVSAQAM